jgi:dienelactone hydrolase
MTKSVEMVLPEVILSGDLVLPDGATGLVVFVHGSGSSRHSPRNRFVAQRLNEEGLGTLLMDLLTEEEELEDEMTLALRFDIDFLAQRVTQTVRWIHRQHELAKLRIGLFGASTGAAAALVAAADLAPGEVGAVVSRGGRPDLAGPLLASVRCPTLLIIGGEDDVVVGLNEEAQCQISGIVEMKIVPGATHLFSEPGALEEVANLAAGWFKQMLGDISEAS